MKKIAKVIIVVVSIIMIGYGAYEIYSAFNKTFLNGSLVKSIEKQQSKPILVSDEITTGEFGNKYIVGTIENNTDKDYSYLQVEFNLYDEEGNLIGTAMDNINNLKAGKTWKFKALATTDLTGEEFSKYEFVEVTGW